MSEISPTPDQKNAIDFQYSMVIIAKPGSGKTYVVSEKIRSVLPTLQRHQGVIAISYTNKASDELRNRSTTGGIDKKASFFGTIDKFCDGEIIIPFLTQLWGAPSQEITVCKIDSLDVEAQESFSNINSNQVCLHELVEHLDLIQHYFLSGKLFLETNGALALYTVINSKACQRYIKARYTHIFIDEYQDSGLEQHELFIKLKELGLIAVAVGDADQSIYQFSGKSPEYLLSLAKEDDFKSFTVSVNHRCHPSIVNYSLQLLDEDATLLTSDETRVFEKNTTGSQEGIANWIDINLHELCDTFNVEKNSDIGILVRGKVSGGLVDSSLSTRHRYFVTHPLEEHFSLWARLFCRLLKYRFDRAVTAQEIIDDSSIVLSSTSIQSLRNQIRKIREVPQNELPDIFVDVTRSILPHSRSDEAVHLLHQSVESDLASSFNPAVDEEVQIMSLHKAKGLEFDIVFHLDMYEWILPAKRPGPGGDFDNPVYPSLEQDINLHYVGVTRARKACFLCTSTKRGANDYRTGSLVLRNGSRSEFLGINHLDILRQVSKV